MSIGFSGLVNSAATESAGKNYALFVGDIVLTNEVRTVTSESELNKLMLGYLLLVNTLLVNTQLANTRAILLLNVALYFADGACYHSDVVEKTREAHQHIFEGKNCDSCLCNCSL